MEAAALYAAKAKGVRVLCSAHVTNTMGLADQDFEKGGGWLAFPLEGLPRSYPVQTSTGQVL